MCTLGLLGEFKLYEHAPLKLLPYKSSIQLDKLMWCACACNVSFKIYIGIHAFIHLWYCSLKTCTMLARILVSSNIHTTSLRFVFYISSLQLLQTVCNCCRNGGWFQFTVCILSPVPHLRSKKWFLQTNYQWLVPIPCMQQINNLLIVYTIQPCELLFCLHFNPPSGNSTFTLYISYSNHWI